MAKKKAENKHIVRCGDVYKIYDKAKDEILDDPVFETREEAHEHLHGPAKKKKKKGASDE